MEKFEGKSISFKIGWVLGETIVFAFFLVLVCVIAYTVTKALLGF